MSEHFENENENGPSFAELFESYNTGMKDDLQVGDKVKGEIISIGKDTVFVNTGTKIDGAVERSELLDKDGQMPYQVGDTLDLYVTGMDENEIRLSRALSGAGGLNLLREAYEGKLPVEGKVKAQCKGGFEIEIMQHRAFCPLSQMDVKYIEKPEDYVGSAHRFLISRIEEKGRNIVVSRRQLLAGEQEKAKAEFLGNVKIGDVLEGRVTHLAPFGAFVELFPGMEGMIHISELSWSRVQHTEDVLHPDDSVKVKIIGMEPGKKPGEMKISLSLKQAMGDPWDTAEQTFRVGERVQGKVTRVAGFGAFVEIAPGIEGLVHVSEMSYTRRVNRPEDVVQPGQTVEVMIREIDLQKKRISLSIRDAQGDPWIGIRDRYKVGQQAKGIMEKKEKFGYFVTLEPGITGLLPKSKISDSAKAGEIDHLRPGDPITVTISEIQPEVRKITLSPEGSGPKEKEADDWRKFAGSSSDSLGSLGEKLKKAMKRE
ncbi:MAG: 30S ribosomal protein S1 [Desulfobacterales bacterium]